MKRVCAALVAVALLLCLAPAACAANTETKIVLSDSGVTVDGAAISQNTSAAVYGGADIVYYEEGKDASYGEGTAADAHSAAEAAAHTVVTITQPGVYRLSGTLSQGQVAVDLGADAAEDAAAVVTLILDGVDISCTVAPAVIFYNVYECGVVDEAAAGPIVDTTKAGANVILADGSENLVNGSYVARIYKEGTTKKLHKYDGAFYSKMSMNVSAETAGTGVLRITAENEGLDSELHLTINGGNIYIDADNDGINTNEDNVSVTTINGGTLTINAGTGAEGDGIDSNGYLTINGGTILSQANHLADGGIDADKAITVNGGTVLALGGRNDAIASSSTQQYFDLTFAVTQSAGSTISIRSSDGTELISFTSDRLFRNVTFSAPALAEGTTYHVYLNGVQQQYTASTASMGGFGGPGGFGGGRPEGTMGEPPEGFDPSQFENGERPERPEGMEMPEGFDPSQMEGREPPDGFDPSQMEGMTPPDGTGRPEGEGASQTTTANGSVDFTLTAEQRSFSGVSASSGESAGFTDVSANHPQYSQIQYVAQTGIMLGTGESSFSPDATVTRAMMVTIFGRMEQITEAADSTSFSDVDLGSWYGQYVGWAEENAVVEGYSDGHFLPEGTVTRAEACVMLYRYAQLTGHELTEGTLSLSDAASLADWAAAEVASLQSAGLLTGLVSDGGALSPNAPLTRAELAVLIYNLTHS